MAFNFICPKCNSVLQAEDAWEGRATSCPHCGNAIVIVRSSGDGCPPVDKAKLERTFRGWLISLIVMALLFIAMLIALFCLMAQSQQEASVPTLVSFIVFLLLFLGCLVWHVVMWAILLYRFWQLIPPERAATTPEKAVGFMFIPVFNWYWQFIAWWKLGKAFDQEGVSSQLGTLTLVYCILNLVNVLPSRTSGGLTGLAALVLYIVIVVSFRKAALRLLKRRSEAVEPMK